MIEEATGEVVRAGLPGVVHRSPNGGLTRALRRYVEWRWVVCPWVGGASPRLSILNSPVTVITVEVVITCMEHAHAKVRLHECVAFDADITTISAELRASGLEVAQRGVELLDRDGLACFFARLEQDFAGWEGERIWRSFHDELGVTARFHSRGRVELRWRVTQRLESAAEWSAIVTTWIHAGEDLRRLAADLRALFDAR